MEIQGINWGFFIAQLVNFLIIGGWSLFSLIALFKLRRSPLTETNRVLWALLIIAIPVLGALAFFVIRPGESSQPKTA